jgi:hypothetical protein
MSIQCDSTTGRISVRTVDNAEVGLVEASAAYSDSTERDQDTVDRADLRLAVAVLIADAGRLEDQQLVLSAQQLRAHLARTNRALVAIVRSLARRGL